MPLVPQFSAIFTRNFHRTSVIVVDQTCNRLFPFLTRPKGKLYDVLKATGGGFWRDMEQAIDDNQGCGDARLRGASHVEWQVLVSYPSVLRVER